MKRLWLGVLLAGLMVSPAASINAAMLAGNGSYLIAAAQTSDATKTADKNKDKKEKDKVHGAEMSTVAVLATGAFALSAYFFLARRSHRRT